jgi:hypothetical protein
VVEVLKELAHMLDVRAKSVRLGSIGRELIKSPCYPATQNAVSRRLDEE